MSLQVVTVVQDHGTLGATLERDADGGARVVATRAPDLRVGDRILSVDGEPPNVPGTPWQRIRAEGDVLRGPVALRLERDGAPLELLHEPVSQRPRKIPYLLMSLACGFTGLLIGRRGVATGAPRRMAEASLAGGAAFLGPTGSPLAVVASFLCTSLATGALGPLAVRGMLSLSPAAEPRGAWFRGSVALLWLRGLTHPISWYGAPGLSTDGMAVVQAIDRALVGWMGFLLLLVVVRGRRIASESVRRRTDLAALISGSAMAALVANTLSMVSGGPHVGPPWRELPWGIMPLGLLLSDLEELDLERRMSGTLAAALFATGGVALALWLLPRAVAWIGAAGFDPGTSVALVAVAVVGVGVPVSRRAGPRLEALFFPDRAELRAGLDQLLRDLHTCQSPAELAELLAARLGTLLRPRTLAVYLRRDEGGLGAVVSAGADAPPRLAAEGGFGRELAARPGALSLQRGDPLERPDLDASDRQLVRELDPAVLLPLRRGRHLDGVVGIGARRSREVYSPTDLAMLAAVAEEAGRVLEGFAQDAMQAQSADQSRFLATASHDLRQPLGALSHLAEGLGARAADPETRDLVERLRASVGDLRELFEGVLDVSKLEATGEEPQISRFPLALLLERLRQELEPEARAAGLDLRVASGDVTVESDPVLLRRILQNLLTNALKYTQQGSVELRLRPETGGEGERDAVWVEVVDTGTGLDAGEQRRVFEEWKRSDSEATRAIPGVGLGLSIVRRLAVSLGHRVEVASLPGRGSCFSVRVPTAAAIPPATHGDALDGRAVLVVDADAERAAALESMLRGFGCEVRCVASGEQARALADQADFAFSAQPLELGVPLARLDDAGDAGDEVLRVRTPLRPARLRAIATRLAALSDE
ncbi:MAG: ATP-binding protein [Myxococcota bacterium]